MKTSTELIGFDDVRDWLRPERRAALFIRHSERPPLRQDDRRFGRHLGLTPHGIELARLAGARLAGISDTAFLSSPMKRCRLTARCLAEGMGQPDATVRDARRLGIHGYYYEDPVAVQAAMQQRGYMPYMLDYLRDGKAPHSRPIGPATEQTAAWLRRRARHALTLLVSHDIFIAAFLTGLRVRTYAADDWVGFLNGAALLHDPASGWTCHPCAPEGPTASSTPFIH